MREITDILEKHWKQQNVKYSRTGDNLKWNKTLRNVRCALCGKSSHEKKLDEAFLGWGVLLFHWSEAGKMPEVCPKCMVKISDRQIPVPRIAVCVECGITQREKIFGLGFFGWQTIRFPAQGIRPGAIRITDLWCPDCSIKLARKLGPTFIHGTWTALTYAANSLLTSTKMTANQANFLEAQLGRDNLCRNAAFASRSQGTAKEPDEWTQEGTPTIAYAAVDTGYGDFAVKLEATGAGDEGINITLTHLKPLAKYQVFARVKVDAGDTASLITTGATTNINVDSTSAAWEDIVGEFITDAGATDVVIKLVASAATDVAYFCGITCVEGDIPPGNFIRRVNETIYLTTPITDGSWDGDGKSTGEANIDLSTFGNGCPPGIKAVFLHIAARDSGSSGDSDDLVIGPGDIAIGANVIKSCLRVYLFTIADNTLVFNTGKVPCNSDGDIHYQVRASGANTLDAYIVIWGYILGE